MAQVIGSSANAAEFTQSTSLSNPPDPRDNRPVFQVAQTPSFTAHVPGTSKLGALNGFRTVGYLREDFPGNNVRAGGPFALYFMYNPTEIDLGYNFDPTLIPPDYQNSDQLAAPNLVTNQEFSFSLFFDRSLEVWRDPKHPGTLMDQRAMERILGIYDTMGGPPQSSRVRVFFGGTSFGIPSNWGNVGTGAGPGAITRTGYVIGLGITHTRFDRAMTPIHCAMQLTIQQVWNPPDYAPLSVPSPSVYNGPNPATLGTGPAQSLPTFRKGPVVAQ